MKTKILTSILTIATIPMAIGANYTAHEWGTFTSVINKEGKMIQGLHHEEEALPNFVYDLSRVEKTSINIEPSPSPPSRPRVPRTRGFNPASMDLMPIPTFTERITQKMETPVIYFYADKEIDVNVKVDFPKGVISQWYPKVSSVNPSTDEAKDGYAVWDIKILTERTGVLPETSGNSIWNPSREVNSNIIQTGQEKEKLIFYRGLADFNVPLVITENNGIITIQNNSNQEIKGITLLENREDFQLMRNIQNLAAQSEVKISMSPKNSKLMMYTDFNRFLTAAKGTIIKDLVQSGLFVDESRAMVNTWEGGYFQTKGLRLLYVLPREWTDTILPITMNPAPKNLVRTLVGRIEIITGQEDQKIKKFVESDVKENKISSLDINGRELKGLGHFPEPKLRRALQLDIDDSLKEKVNNLITKMNQGF